MEREQEGRMAPLQVYRFIQISRNRNHHHNRNLALATPCQVHYQVSLLQNRCGAGGTTPSRA